MEKKKYITPRFEVIVLKHTSQLLAGSGEPAGRGFSYSDDPATDEAY